MARVLSAGARLQGRLDTYTLSAQLFKGVWSASGSRQKVIVKFDLESRLKKERDVLFHFQGQPRIRQLVDEVADPPCLVLEYLDDNLLNASNKKRLGNEDLKSIAREVLEALKTFHEAGYIHTDVKPDNILIDHGNDRSRFSCVKLGDCGDTCSMKSISDLVGEGHVIGAAIFRSPEAMLNLRWGMATEIWSFGATLISLIWGNSWHIFKPDDLELTPGSEAYALQVLVKQVRFFGPVPPKFKEIACDESLDILDMVTTHIEETYKPKPFSMAEDPELSLEDRIFLCKIMKFDPRERPTAGQLLQDSWFRSIKHE